MVNFKSPQTGTISKTDFISDQLNILAHAQAIELNLGSTCGGHGVCGKDRIRISVEDLKFFSKPTSEEKKHLTQNELNSGIRLACQCYPNISTMSFTIEYGV